MSPRLPRLGLGTSVVCGVAMAALVACGAAQGPSTPCTTGAECKKGHACTAGTCSASCDAALCGLREDCTSETGECQPVECSSRVACEAAGQICDWEIRTCYPANGACASAVDCPPLPASLADSVVEGCEAGFCRLQARQPAVIRGFEGAESVGVASPTAGESFAAETDIRFAWGGPKADASIVLALDGPVLSQDELAGGAVWGAVRTAEQERMTSVADGHVIASGLWQPGPGTLPAGRPLYFLVQLLVAPGKVVAASVPVPFIVGASWPGLGDPCPLTGTCINPARPQACRSGTCELACASHLDCLPYGLACGSFAAGVRVCE